MKISSALLYICHVTNGLCSEARKSHQLFQEQALSHMLQSLMTQCNLSDCEAMKSNLSELTNKSTQLLPHPFFPSSSFIFFSLFTECVPTCNISSSIYQRKFIRHVEQNYCDSATLGPLEWSINRSLYVNFVLNMRLV